MKMQIFVMPARIAGIQVREDASGNVHVNLDSSTPCWNDQSRGLIELTEPPPPRIFKGAFFGRSFTLFRMTDQSNVTLSRAKSLDSRLSPGRNSPRTITILSFAVSHLQKRML